MARRRRKPQPREVIDEIRRLGRRLTPQEYEAALSVAYGISAHQIRWCLRTGVDFGVYARLRRENGAFRMADFEALAPEDRINHRRTL